MGISLNTAIETQRKIFGDCSKVVEKKGADYNREQQKTGDTLFNMRVSALTGIVRSPQKGVLVRMMDKMQRLNSLENPTETPANKDEAVYDTVCDLINYATYFYMFYAEERRDMVAVGATINAEANESEKTRAEQGYTELGH
jgi:uncharacterized protein (DUF169 family)